MRRINRTLKIIGRLKLSGKKSFLFGYNHIFLLIVSILFLSTAMGINSVSLPLILYNHGIATSLIGFSTASDVLGGIITIFLLHKLSKKIGIFNSIFLFSSIAAIAILILPFYQNFILWFALSFALGTAMISVITLRRAWINIAVRAKIRSMIIAVSSAVLCTGFTIGPIIVKFLGASSYEVFIISAIFIMIGSLVLLPIRKTQPTLTSSSKLRLMVLIKRNPRIMLARFLTDLQCGTIMFFTVIYGIKSGISAENSGLLISVFSSIGMLDFLIGFLINQRSYQRLILLGFTGFLVFIISLPLVINNYYFAIIIFIALGWITSLVAICCWYGANLRKRKGQMIFINSAFMAVGLFGVFIGNLLTGIAMQYFGKEGFVIVIFLASVVYLAIYLKNLVAEN